MGEPIEGFLLLGPERVELLREAKTLRCRSHMGE
jgi:hypothetical protein